MSDNNHMNMEQAFIQLTNMFPALCMTLFEYYTELVKSGFNEQQALQIVSNFLPKFINGGN